MGRARRLSRATISLSPLCSFVSTVIQVILLDRMQRLGTWVVETQYPQSLGKPEWEKDECVTRTPSTNSHHTPALRVRRGPYTPHSTSHTCTACQKGPVHSTLHITHLHCMSEGPVHSTLHITHTGGPQESWPDSDAVLSIYVQSKSDSDMKTGTDRKQL